MWIESRNGSTQSRAPGEPIEIVKFRQDNRQKWSGETYKSVRTHVGTCDARGKHFLFLFILAGGRGWAEGDAGERCPAFLSMASRDDSGFFYWRRCRTEIPCRPVAREKRVGRNGSTADVNWLHADSYRPGRPSWDRVAWRGTGPTELTDWFLWPCLWFSSYSSSRSS